MIFSIYYSFLSSTGENWSKNQTFLVVALNRSLFFYFISRKFVELVVKNEIQHLPHLLDKFTREIRWAKQIKCLF